MKDLKIKKCMHCGALVKVLEDCNCENCGIKCCGEEMKELISNSTDAAIEKHVPSYEIKGDKLLIKVNHVMENEHFIEWIVLVTDKGIQKKKLTPGSEPRAEFALLDGEKVVSAYEFCNLHKLWKC